MATPAWPAPTTSVSTVSIDISGPFFGIPRFSADATGLGTPSFAIGRQESFIEVQLELRMARDIFHAFAIDIDLKAVSDRFSVLFADADHLPIPYSCAIQRAALDRNSAIPCSSR